MARDLDVIISSYNRAFKKIANVEVFKRLYIDSLKAFVIFGGMAFLSILFLVLGVFISTLFFPLLFLVLFIFFALLVAISSLSGLFFMNYSYNLKNGKFVHVLGEIKSLIHSKKFHRWFYASIVSLIPTFIILIAFLAVVGVIFVLPQLISGTEQSLSGFTKIFAVFATLNIISIFLIIVIFLIIYLIYSMYMPLVYLYIYLKDISIKEAFIRAFHLLRKKILYLIIYLISILILSQLLNILISISYVLIIGPLFLIPVLGIYAMVIYFPLFELEKDM